MPSPAHEAIVAGILANSANAPAEPPTIEQSRAGMEAMTAAFPLPADAVVEQTSVGGVPGVWVSRPAAREGVAVLYFHGGGYLLGSSKSHTELAARIAGACAARVLVVDYRLGPENKFPAAVEDAVAAYRALLADGFEPARIVLAGDSAGGGLTLATLVALREGGEALPACAVCLSPYADLTPAGQPASNDDPLLTAEALAGFAAGYVQDGDPSDPKASPALADYSGFPPLLIQVGTRERLLSDAEQCAERARAARVDVTLEKYDGLIHVWQLFGPQVPEAIDAVDKIGAFVKKHT